MKQKTGLFLYLFCSAILITAALYAGRNAYEHCNQCHFYSHDTTVASNIYTDHYKN
ncbi:MAG: hypothetical protein ABIN36_04725 [Ferruginibacter sp.]